MSEIKSTRIAGTKEWASESANIILGCEHRCRYCYARANALRRKQIPNHDVWGTEYNRVRPQEVRKRRKLLDGTVMFPTTHDITPEHLDACLTVIENLLVAGNRVLLVSKPHLACVQAICGLFPAYREQILFRFSIGGVDDSVLSYWEPGAPSFAERIASLSHAFRAGYATSVSAEPLLQANKAVELVKLVSPWVTDSVWIGKMNGIHHRVIPGTDPLAIHAIETGQTDNAVRAVYESLQCFPLVKWKESYKCVVGIPLAEHAGLDI